MTLDQNLIDLVDQRIRMATKRTRAVGTCVTRDSTGPGATVTWDGSTVAMPVKVLGTVFLRPGDRCLLDLYGSQWIVTGGFSAQGNGEASHVVLGTSMSTTSTTFVDFTDFGTFTFTKIFDGTFIRVATQVGCFSSVANTGVRFGVRLTPQDAGSTYVATDNNLAVIFFNAINTHVPSYSALRLVGVPAGNYTVSLRWRRNAGTGTLSADSGDQFMVEMDEQVRAGDPYL